MRVEVKKSHETYENLFGPAGHKIILAVQGLLELVIIGDSGSGVIGATQIVIDKDSDMSIDTVPNSPH